MAVLQFSVSFFIILVEVQGLGLPIVYNLSQRYGCSREVSKNQKTTSTDSTQISIGTGFRFSNFLMTLIDMS